jgi:hypothetical protein
VSQDIKDTLNSQWVRGVFGSGPGGRPTGWWSAFVAVGREQVRVLRTQTARFSNDADAQGALMSTRQPLSVAGDGDQVLVQAFAFGRIDNGILTRYQARHLGTCQSPQRGDRSATIRRNGCRTSRGAFQPAPCQAARCSSGSAVQRVLSGPGRKSFGG